MKTLLLLSVWICSSAYAQAADSAQFYFQKGLEEKTAKRYLVACQAFENAVKFKSSFTNAWLQQGFTNMEMKRTDKAKICFTKVLESDPANREAINQLTQIYFNYRQFPQAIEFADKCIDCENSARIKGMSYYQQEDYPQAEKFLLQALSKDGSDAEVTYTLAKAYLDMELYNQAAVYYEKSITMAPTKTAWIYELGILYSNLFDYKNALLCYTSAAEKGYVQSNDFKENYGYAALYAGQFEMGEELLMNVWKKKPGNRDILRGIAEILYKGKQYDKSLGYCQKLMELDSKDGQALYQAGLCFQKKGEKDRGQQMCDKAIEMDPSLASLRRKKDIAGM